MPAALATFSTEELPGLIAGREQPAWRWLARLREDIVRGCAHRESVQRLKAAPRQAAWRRELRGRIQDIRQARDAGAIYNAQEADLADAWGELAWQKVHVVETVLSLERRLELFAARPLEHGFLRTVGELADLLTNPDDGITASDALDHWATGSEPREQPTPSAPARPRITEHTHGPHFRQIRQQREELRHTGVRTLLRILADVEDKSHARATIVATLATLPADGWGIQSMSSDLLRSADWHLSAGLVRTIDDIATGAADNYITEHDPHRQPVKVAREVKRAIVAAHLTSADVDVVLAIRGKPTAAQRELRDRLGDALAPMYSDGWDHRAMADELGCTGPQPCRRLASIVKAASRAR
jgi:hypothetical protein